MNETSQREEQLFMEALEIPGGTMRSDFLAQKCGTDVELQTRVEQLLDFHEQKNNILDETSQGLLGVQNESANDNDINIGSTIGPYKLLQEIGVGGMGVVFMADQSQPVRRKVAVKIIKLGMDTRNVIARFEAERQALAMMDHPNITKVFDAGRTESGRPYFAMELVTGLAITDYCDKKRLPLRKRLELFHKVCLGVKHAHQKGIIHRDLKPSNVMVTHYDGVAVPKIIDFGISKAVDKTLTDKTLFTSYGNMIGTPEYMSPEQAEMSGLDIDTRSDVYSLGVVLYELLTGTTPFYRWKQKGLHKFCEAICNEEPELASTRVNNMANTVDEISKNRSTDVRSLNRKLRGDIDWILSKCMAKDRKRRYESAADLARDIERYLNGQPIEAAGPRMSYRVRKFAAKHRTAFTMATVMLLSLVGATIISTAFAISAIQSEQRATASLQKVEVLQKKAEDERDRAIEAEKRLQVLERQSRNAVATVRASNKFKEENPGVWVFTSSTDQLPDNSPASNTEVEVQNMVLRSSQGGGATIPVPGPPGATRSIRVMHPDKLACKVMFSPEGKITVTQSNVSTDGVIVPGEHLDHRSAQFVVVQDSEGNDQTKRFLRYLADEQRQLFGKDDRMVANTLIEIGGLALRNKDWILAEDNLRECREILKKNAITDERIAKVELLLGKALLHQDKIADAKEAFAQSLGKLDDLEGLSDEVTNALQEMKVEFDELDIPVYEIGDHLKKELGGLFHEAVKKRLEKSKQRKEE